MHGPDLMFRNLAGAAESPGAGGADTIQRSTVGRTIKVNVIGDDCPEAHRLRGYRGDLWISLSSAVAAWHHPYGKGVVVLLPDGGELLINERVEDLVRRAAEAD